MEQLALSDIEADELPDDGRTAPSPPAPARPRRAELAAAAEPLADEGQDDEHQDDDEHQEERADEAGQLALLPGAARRGTIPGEVWAELIGHEPTRARYQAKVWHDADEGACWFWLGALSSSGHGKLRAGPGARTVVTAHVYGWQLHRGLIRARPGEDPVVAHRCDESSCQRPDHWELIERTANGADYLRRRHRAEGPLADVRGAAGRAAAIRAAILDTQAHGGDAAAVRAAIRAAQAEGVRRADSLF